MRKKERQSVKATCKFCECFCFFTNWCPACSFISLPTFYDQKACLLYLITTQFKIILTEHNSVFPFFSSLLTSQHLCAVVYPLTMSIARLERCLYKIPLCEKKKLKKLRHNSFPSLSLSHSVPLHCGQSLLPSAGPLSLAKVPSRSQSQQTFSFGLPSKSNSAK